MSGRPFERFIAWQRAIDLAEAIYRETAVFPDSEKFGLTAQLRRSAVSVSANIAEGSAKKGKAEFRRFLDVSLGSLSELSGLIILSHRLGFLDDRSSKALQDLREATGKPLWGLYRSLLSK